MTRYALTLRLSLGALAVLAMALCSSVGAQDTPGTPDRPDGATEPAEPDDPEAAPGPEDSADEEPRQPPAGVQVVRDLRYRQLPGVNPNAVSLDIYSPRGGEKRPVVVYVHGGGWKAGDKSRVAGKPELFNGVGWVFISINYRLLPRGQHPKNAQDVAAALAWVHAHIAEYRGDPDRILLTGHSAGAHLAALVAADERRLKEFGCELSLIKAVVALDTGSYDINWQIRQNARHRARMVESFGTDDADVFADASPLHFLKEDGSYAPWLLISSEGRAFGIEQANKVASVIRASGSPADVFEASGKNHGAVNQDLGKPGDEMTKRVMTWFFTALELEVPDRFRFEGNSNGNSDGGTEPRRQGRPFREILPELNLNAAQRAQLRGLVQRYRGKTDDPGLDRALRMVLSAEQYRHLMRELGREPDADDRGEGDDEGADESPGAGTGDGSEAPGR